MLHVDGLLGSASSTLVANHFVLDFVFRLGKSAIRAENELFNVPVHEFLQDIIRVCSIDNGAVRGRIVTSLCTEFRPKKLVDFPGRAMQGLGYFGNVWNGRLDSIARALNLSKNRNSLW